MLAGVRLRRYVMSSCRFIHCPNNTCCWCCLPRAWAAALSFLVGSRSFPLRYNVSSLERRGRHDARPLQHPPFLLTYTQHSSNTHPSTSGSPGIRIPSYIVSPFSHQGESAKIKRHMGFTSSWCGSDALSFSSLDLPLSSLLAVISSV
ncbi:hypothetical protein P280DRAFT_85571 [Massarina eburnea CBS 473.64]|uniref:Uncharacterized protein n=1 Tax=Massarina eburnea CBS 473.64 TaxID=1395130 RepID=A0A6A6RU36_9PLEO|nr:hypothetical protein P280DRAFT_85571 [Massarina eburnea CBS 473.64]